MDMHQPALAIGCQTMAAKRDRNRPHPARAAAWRALGRAAQRGRRICADIYLTSVDHEFAHRTGTDTVWPPRNIGDLIRRPRSLGD